MMKLYYSNTSPYSRKVRVVIREKGLTDLVEEIPCNPFEEVPALLLANPLGKIPTLVTDSGDSIYDSPVISEYLDALDSEVTLLPSSGVERWQVLRWQALTDGILDAAYNVVMERRRPETEQSESWIQHWSLDIDRTVQQADVDLTKMSDTISLAQIGLGCSLGYLNFRLSEIDWQQDCPGLAQWYKEFVVRPSMIETMPD